MDKIINENDANTLPNNEDLQERHDEIVKELGLIDEALAKAGFVNEPSGENISVQLSVSARFDVALALLASSRDDLILIGTALGDHGMQVEGERPVETAVKLIGAHKALLSMVEETQADAQRVKDASQAAADRAARKPKAVKGVVPQKLRPCGVYVMRDYLAKSNKAKNDPRLSAEGLLRLIEQAETVELAFSDGSHEIDDVPPMLISGEAWKIANDRLFLTGVDVPMYGASRDMSPFTLAGYGLFLDGQLAAYAPRINGPLVIAPGSTHSLNGDVVFG